MFQCECVFKKVREKMREMESKEKTHLSNIAFLLSSRMDGIGSGFPFVGRLVNNRFFSLEPNCVAKTCFLLRREA